MKNKFIALMLIFQIIFGNFLLYGCENKSEIQKNSQSNDNMINSAKADDKDNLTSQDIYIGSILVNNQNKDKLKSMIEKKYQKNLRSKKLMIKTPNKNYELEFSKLRVSLKDIDKTINNALKLAKSNSNTKQKKVIYIPINYDKKELETFVQTINKNIYKKPVNASLKGNINNPSIIEGKNGVILDKSKLINNIENNIAKLSSSEDTSLQVTANIKTEHPKITKSSLKQINTKLSSFSTKLGGSDSGRITNIKLTCKSIDGKVVAPGEIFSFNDTVGFATAERGYKEAPVIINNKLEPALGGGRCQVSTTLYNAAIKLNLPSVERQNHTLPVGYIKLGLDATVADGGIDYKFKNNLKYPLLLRGYVKDGLITFDIYSNKNAKKYDYKYDSEIYAVTPNQIDYVYDSNLPKGSQVVDYAGNKGYKVAVYKMTYFHNKQISKELIYKDAYFPSNTVVRIGS